MRMIPVESVKDGAFLAQPLYNEKGQILLAKGVQLNKRYKDKIKELGFNTIYIIDEYSKGELEDIIKPEIRRKTVSTVTSIFNVFSDINNGNLNPFQKKKLEQQAVDSIDNVSSLAKSIVDDLFTQKNLLVNLVDIKNTDSYTYYHSVNVGILGLVLGISIGLNKMDLYDLTLGCILHDAGKMFVPKEILNKNGKLTPEEYRIIKEHTTRGFNYLRDYTDLSSKVRIIALQHQEKVDGSGYPYHLKEDQIYQLSKIASIADVYDALTSDRPYRNALPPNEAVEYIMGGGGSYFNMDMVKAFIKKIIPYPVGTIVQLSNDSIGVVEKINPEFILRPVIRIIKQQNQKVDPFYCDLKDEKNVVIQGVVFNI